MPVNETDVRALTYLATRIRTDTNGAGRWDEAGVAAVISKLQGQGIAQAMERVARHAADRDARTPGAILRPFMPDTQTTSTFAPTDKAETCETCNQPRHPDTKDHPFVPLTHAWSNVATDKATRAERVQALKQDIACNEPTTEESA